MYRVITPALARQAAEQLRRHDPVLKPVIARAGPVAIKPHRNYYWELIDSIISQQLSVKAAAAIERRFRELFGSDFPEPAAILAKSVDELRSVGLSRAKAAYISDLAQHILDGKLQFDKFDAMDNQTVTAELTAVKGIGEWTAHMFLIFCMGRPDVLPTGDLGIRTGIRRLYGLGELPTPAEIRAIADANRWHPYESIASWYVWHSLQA